uniref:Uncharacterized protein n=1 Tax=Rhizophora mucronata TaxID=61149 RepID=A0A2P2K3Q7_RHIMU
MCIRHLSSA